MKVISTLILFAFLLSSCQKEEIKVSVRYTASYTLSSNQCNNDEDYGFRLKGTNDALKSSYFTMPSNSGVQLELVVNVCNSISTSSLPSTIPAIIYKNGEVFLTVELLRSAQNSRRYLYYFNHY